MADKKYYDETDDISEYWNLRYIEWDAKLSFSDKLAVFKSKDEWWETRFSHILPPKRLGMRVLDLGCGNAMYSPALMRRYPHYYGLDTSVKALEIARRYFGKGEQEWHWEKDGRAWAVDLWRQDQVIPARDGLFDLVFTCTVLQHQPVARRVATINEIKRVLKPDGQYVGLEMMGNTQAADMPPMDTQDWLEAWKPLALVRDLPPEHPEWHADNVWYSI